MPGNILWQSGSVTSGFIQLSGQGRQLTNGSIIMCSGLLGNTGTSGGPVFYANFEFVGAPTTSFGAAINANTSVDMYLIPTRDGTNFATASVSGLPFNQYRASFVASVSGNVARWSMITTAVAVSPIDYQVWLQNNTGQTLNSGWSLFFTGNNEAYT